MLWMRMLSQGLAGPRFGEPAQVVEWMGAMQAQEIRAAKWAVALRTESPALSAVREALDSGEILRTHIMRPTWHYVPRRDIRWMASLSGKGMRSAIINYSKGRGLTPEMYTEYMPEVEKVLEGRNLTRQETAGELARKGVELHEDVVHFCLVIGEADGVVCSGAEKDGKHTYALIAERAPDAVELPREEALALLALRYFRSHGPATMEDFIWWSGLGVREARGAVASLGQDIVTDTFNDREMMIHVSSPALNTELYGTVSAARNTFHYLPPFDEYLISYKNRFDCIKESHARHAYNNFGIFQPVVLHNGRVTGNWRKTSKKTVFNTTFFPGCRAAAKRLIEKAGKEYSLYLEQ